MKEDLRGQLRWLEEELHAEEWDDEPEEAGTLPDPGYPAAPDFGRAMFADEDYGIPEEKHSRKNTNTRGLRYLLLLEILGILALIGWWVRWLI